MSEAWGLQEMAAPVDQGAISAAIQAWASALGETKIQSDDSTRDSYARSTQRTGTRPCCILYPESTADVQAIMKIASEHGVVVYPISRGKNWGYGDACAPTEGAAIIDLSRMNKVVELNEELAYCVIESGISQGELYEHLQRSGTGLWMDATAAGPDTSIVGNALEHGVGHTRYGDHFKTCCGLEIVLSDGRVLNTGFGHYANAKTAHLYPYGLGPYLDGMFFQSNFGIVTRMGLWLIPEPEAFTFYYLQAARHEDLETIVDRLRPLRLDGTIQTAVHIGNDFRALGATGRYPWEEAEGIAPMPDHVRMAVRARTGAQAWQASGSFSGTPGHVRASKKALKKAVGDICAVRFVNDRKLLAGERISSFLSAFGFAKVMKEKLRAVRPNYELLKGIPVLQPLLSAQWRLRNPPEGGAGDPLDSGCGAYWVSPVIPMLGREAKKFVSVATDITQRHGFDTNISLIMVNERSLVCTTSVAFDKSVEGESEQAEACFKELMDGYFNEGWIIYRCGVQGMPKIRQEPSVYWDVAQQIKAALDPKDIIARGRYVAPLESRADD